VQLFTAGGKPLLADAVLVVRCPKCIVGIEFRPRISWREGRFVCRDCAHTVLAGTHNRLNAHCIRQSIAGCLRVQGGGEFRWHTESAKFMGRNEAVG